MRNADAARNSEADNPTLRECFSIFKIAQKVTVFEMNFRVSPHAGGSGFENEILLESLKLRT